MWEAALQGAGVVQNAMITRFEEMRKHGRAASMIESQTAKFPIDTFLWAAGGSILASLFLKRQGRDEDALFVGQWAPTFVLLSLVGKLAKHWGKD